LVGRVDLYWEMVSNSTNKKDGGRLIATASVESRKAVMHSSHKNVNQKFKEPWQLPHDRCLRLRLLLWRESMIDDRRQ
jgi:hypothetical protein